jgi:hypothetical protein
MTVDVNDFEIENDGSMESAVTPGAYCSYYQPPAVYHDHRVGTSRPDQLVGRRSYRSRIDARRRQARRPAVCGPWNALELPPEVREMNGSQAADDDVPIPSPRRPSPLPASRVRRSRDAAPSGRGPGRGCCSSGAYRAPPG